MFVIYLIFYVLHHAINFESCDGMMGIGTRVRVHFLMYLLNLKSPGREIWRTNRYSHGH